MRRPIVSNLHSDAPTPRARCSSVEAPHRVFIQGCPKAHSQFPPHEFTDKIGRLGYSFFPARIDYTRLRMLMDKLGRASICGGIKSQVSGRLPAKSSTPRREEEIPISFENHLRVSPSCRFPFSCVATTVDNSLFEPMHTFSPTCLVASSTSRQRARGRKAGGE